MDWKLKKWLLWMGFILMYIGYAASSCAGQSFTCNSNEICWGEGTDISSDDLICITSNNCDKTFRKDNCSQCDSNPSQYDGGTQYRDCKETCYTNDTVANMLKIDECKVCGGTNSTCNPAVTQVNLTVIPDSLTPMLHISGTGFHTPNLQIVILQGGGKTVVTQANINRTQDGSNIYITMRYLTKGTYEIGARTGNNGKEYVPVSGPNIYVYRESEYSVDSLTPNEKDLDGTGNTVDVKLHINLQALDPELTVFYCIVRDSGNGENLNVTDANFTQSTAMLSCTLPIPQTSKMVWVCASFNRFHSFGCRNITFFEVAPAVINNTIIFSSSGDRLSLTFDKAAQFRSASRRRPVDFFTDASKLGIDPICKWNEAKTSLTVNLGGASTLNSSDTLELVADIKSNIGAFSRGTEPITLAVEYPKEITSPIAVAPHGFWPSTVTANAGDTLTLGMEVVSAPAGRRPVSIVWKVNQTVQESSKGKTEIDVVIGEAGQYVIEVTVTDFLGGVAVLTKTIVKTDVQLPNVQFVPRGLTPMSNGKFYIHPNTKFSIGTRIDYTGSLDKYKFQWMRNNVNKNGLYTYKPHISETTIYMCNDSVIYKLHVSKIEDESVFVETALTVIIRCRPIVAIILGSKEVDVQIGSSTMITLDGSQSYDPDCGTLTYLWECFSGKRFKLTVSVGKLDGLYTDSTQVIVNAANGTLRSVRFVTMRRKFRSDVTIMIKAFVGTGVKVDWSFIDAPGYNWLDINSATIGKKSNVVKGFAWYTVHPGQASPGRHYLIQVNVSKTLNGRKVFITQTFEIYIYQTLRLCTILAKPIKEMEKTNLLLMDCMKDPDVKWLDTSCSIENIDLKPGDDLSCYVPVFKNRLIKRSKLTCEVRDSLGHVMVVISNEVNVTLRTNVESELKSVVESLEKNGNLIDAIDMLAGKIKIDGPASTQAMHNNVMGLVGQAQKDVLGSRDIKRILKSVNTLKTDKLTTDETKSLASSIKAMLDSLCDAGVSDETVPLSNIEIKELIIKAKELAEKERENGKQYRNIEDIIACIRIKSMKNEESESVTFADGTKHTYMVDTLDDVNNRGLNITFPEEIKSKYRDLWECGEAKQCHGIGLKVEEYPADPPDLRTGRTDTNCSTYITVDLFNQNSGKSIEVKDLTNTININFGSQCPRARCWYYNKVLQRFDQHGVVNVPQEDGSTQCETKHLSTFTVRSDPTMSNETNVPVIVAICLGSVLLIMSLIVIARSFVVSKTHADNAESENSGATEMTEKRGCNRQDSTQALRTEEEYYPTIYLAE